MRRWTWRRGCWRSQVCIGVFQAFSDAGPNDVCGGVFCSTEQVGLVAISAAHLWSWLGLGHTTDDFKLGHTDDEQGNGMYAEVMRVLQVKLGGEMTEQNPTEDYGSLRHEFVEIDGRAAVTLTQPTQIRRLAEAIFGSERADVPETFVPLPAAWSAVGISAMRGGGAGSGIYVGADVGVVDQSDAVRNGTVAAFLG